MDAEWVLEEVRGAGLDAAVLAARHDADIMSPAICSVSGAYDGLSRVPSGLSGEVGVPATSPLPVEEGEEMGSTNPKNEAQPLPPELAEQLAEILAEALVEDIRQFPDISQLPKSKE